MKYGMALMIYINQQKQQWIHNNDTHTKYCETITEWQWWNQSNNGEAGMNIRQWNAWKAVNNSGEHIDEITQSTVKQQWKKQWHAQDSETIVMKPCMKSRNPTLKRPLWLLYSRQEVASQYHLQRTQPRGRSTDSGPLSTSRGCPM